MLSQKTIRIILNALEHYREFGEEPEDEVQPIINVLYEWFERAQKDSIHFTIKSGYDKRAK